MKYQVPDNVAYIDGADMQQGEVLYLTLLPLGQSVRLEGVARLLWIVAAAGGDAVSESAILAGEFADRVAPEVGSFLAELMDRGFLTEGHDSGGEK